MPIQTLKGHKFDPEKPESLPGFFFVTRNGQRVYSKERIEQEAIALTNRYEIVETCKECGELLIAEEILAHKMNHVPSTIRHLVRTLMAVSPKIRSEILAIVKELS